MLPACLWGCNGNYTRRHSRNDLIGSKFLFLAVVLVFSVLTCKLLGSRTTRKGRELHLLRNKTFMDQSTFQYAAPAKGMKLLSKRTSFQQYTENYIECNFFFLQSASKQGQGMNLFVERNKPFFFTQVVKALDYLKTMLNIIHRGLFLIV